MRAVGAGLLGGVALLAAERELRAAHFAPPPRLTCAEWADERRVLSSESSSAAGQWYSLPFQREIMDTIGGRHYRRVVVMMPSQVSGKTECCVLNPIGYLVDLAPGPMLAIEPTLEMARALSKDRIDPMFRDSPALRGRRRAATGRREADSTILFKSGPGWRLTLVGANSAAGLAMRPIRDVFADEPDRYPPSAGDEGDPVSLAEKRQSTFPDRVTVLSGSPTLEGSSKIAAEYAHSDRRTWQVPCPHCGHRQSLEWGGPEEPFGLKWDRDPAGAPVAGSAYYLCAGCGASISESQKGGMNAAGAWVPGNPGHPTAGFQMTALPSPLVLWDELVAEWYKAQGDPEQVKVFVNTRLARTYAPPGETVNTAAIVREAQPADAAGFPVVPLGAGLLTMWTDVQMNRLETLVTAWGPGEEAWHLYLTRIAGDPLKPEVWRALEAVRTRAWLHASGASVRVVRSGVDSGTWTSQVADYVRPLERQGVMATKGSSNLLAEPLRNPGSKRSDKYRIRVWEVGTIRMKDTFFGRLQRVTVPGPGYQHFTEGVDAVFLEQLGAERREPVRRGTQTFWHYTNPGKKPNEAIDLVVGNLAVLYSLGDAVRKQLDQMRAVVLAAAPAPPADPSAPVMVTEEATEPPAPPSGLHSGGLRYDVPSRNWVTEGWR